MDLKWLSAFLAEIFFSIINLLFNHQLKYPAQWKFCYFTIYLSEEKWLFEFIWNLHVLLPCNMTGRRTDMSILSWLFIWGQLLDFRRKDLVLLLIVHFLIQCLDSGNLVLCDVPGNILCQNFFYYYYFTPCKTLKPLRQKRLLCLKE